MFLQGRRGWGHRQVGPTAAAAMEMATRLPFGCLWGLQTLLLQLLGCFCALWPREMLAKAEAVSFWGRSGEPNPVNPHPAPGGKAVQLLGNQEHRHRVSIKRKRRSSQVFQNWIYCICNCLISFLILLCKDVACPRLSNHKAW